MAANVDVWANYLLHKYTGKADRFSKIPQALWDLGLVQAHLKRAEEIYVLLSMFRYADFKTGECVVVRDRLRAESGFKWLKDIAKAQKKIVRIGAFWRPKGGAGFKKINGKWLTRYYRATNKQIIENAIAKGLIPDEKMQEIEMKCMDQKLKEQAESPDEPTAPAEPMPEDDPGVDQDQGSGLDDVPETRDGIRKQCERQGMYGKTS